MPWKRCKLIVLGASLATLASGPPAIVQAQATSDAGTLTGRVIDQGSQAPLPSARVYIVGTSRGVETNDQGQYRLGGLPAGTHQVRVVRLGYEAVTRPLTVAPRQSQTMDFTMRATAVALDQVTVTATGEQIRTRETGNVVANIAPTVSELSSTNNITDLLTSRAPGVYVQQSTGTTGTASRIRIRGANSVSLSNEPLLVIDGIRASNEVGNRQVVAGGLGTNVGSGGQVTSRFNDINPEDIESIEVIKGPAGVALYGTAAANGVIQITTKRGRAGATQLRFYGEARGSSLDHVPWPDNLARNGTLTNGSATTACTLDAATRARCTPGAIANFNPLETYSPFRDGSTYALGGSASGGNDRVTYFASFDTEREKGVFLTNEQNKNNLRGNIRSQLRDNWDLQFNSAYVNSKLVLPTNDNSTLGIIPVGLLGRAFDDPDGKGFFNNLTPDQLYNINNKQFVDRFINSLTSNYQVTNWLSVSGVAGLDLVNELTRQQITPNRVFVADLPQGNATSNMMQIYNWTGQGNATATFERGTWRSTTQIGAQYTRERFRGTNAFGAVLTSGTGSLNGASSRFAVGEFNTDNITLGAYAQQQLSFADRVFFTAGVRTDDNSAFGSTSGRVYYPSLNTSWVLSDEGFFPQSTLLSSLRLRAAYGQSGQRPLFRNAITFFSPVAVRVNDTEVGAITFNNGGVGNPTLKPEISAEFEGGLDAAFLNERLNVQLTYYDKTTRDQLIQRPIPPSVGAAANRFENIGKTTNSGIELMLNAKVLDTRQVSLDLTVGGSTNKNELIDLGAGIAPITFNGGRQFHRNGYAMGGYWQRPIKSFQDLNGDGIISRANCPGQTQVPGAGNCEIVVGDTVEYLGNPLPQRELQFNGRMGLFNNRVRFSALLDHRSDYKVLNLTSRFRCVFVQNCRAANDPTAPLDDQAATIAGLMGTDAGFLEDGSFTRLRELSVTLAAPSSWARLLRAGEASLTIAGRNLALWSDYKGLDPEITSSPGANFSSSDFLTTPPVRHWTARFNFSF